MADREAALGRPGAPTAPPPPPFRRGSGSPPPDYILQKHFIFGQSPLKLAAQTPPPLGPQLPAACSRACRLPTFPRSAARSSALPPGPGAHKAGSRGLSAPSPGSGAPRPRAPRRTSRPAEPPRSVREAHRPPHAHLRQEVVHGAPRAARGAQRRDSVAHHVPGPARRHRAALRRLSRCAAPSRPSPAAARSLCPPTPSRLEEEEEAAAPTTRSSPAPGAASSQTDGAGKRAEAGPGPSPARNSGSDPQSAAPGRRGVTDRSVRSLGLKRKAGVRQEFLTKLEPL